MQRHQRGAQYGVTASRSWKRERPSAIGSVEGRLLNVPPARGDVGRASIAGVHNDVNGRDAFFAMAKSWEVRKIQSG